MVRARFFRIASCLVVGAALATRSAAAGNTPPTLTLTPAELSVRTLSATDATQIEVTIQAAEQQLDDIVLTSFSNDGINAVVVDGEAKIAKLGPHSAQAWRLQITRLHGALVSAAKLHVRVAYDVAESANKRVHGFAYANLMISPPTVPNPLDLANVEIKGTLPSLSHERSGTLFVIINNKYSRPIDVDSIDAQTPKFIELKRQLTAVAGQSPSGPPPFSIPVGEAHIVAYDVNVPDRVVPGNYGIIVAVRLKTEDGLTGTATASKDVEVSVLSDSLLSLIGVPTFLVLPGVLMIISWRLLSAWGKTDEQRAKFPLQASSADFWAVAILLSLFAAAVYPFLTRLLLSTERNYLVSYGFVDFVYIFAFAFLAGVVSHLFWRLGVWKYRQHQIAELAKITPIEDERPLALLEKLSECKSTIVFPTAKLKEGDKELDVLVLTPWREPTHLWVAPPAIIVQIDPNDFDGLNKLQDIVEQKIQNAAEVTRLVRERVDNKKWKIDWQPPLSGPRRKEAAAVIESEHKVPLLKQE